ncbi:MAG: adenylosuccinate synthase [Acidobacteriota bacterium]
MPHQKIAIVGTQWGDEGKGKLSDWIAERADVVVRFQGGHNAGHTVVVGETTYKLNLLPSGVLRSDTLSVIGNGVVVDPLALAREIESVRAAGVEISPETLLVADNAPMLLPLHADLDGLREDGEASHIGTTRRGIGPAYEDKVARRAVRFGDLQAPDTLGERVERLLVHHNMLRRGSGRPELDGDALIAELRRMGEPILPFVGDAATRLYELVERGAIVVFEGAQGAMLDTDHGTYPYVTSSNTTAAQVGVGTGLGAHAVDHVLGVTKAYSTRVGAGPFPTELDGALADHLATRGHEVGTNTGRNRRVGWFDAVMVRQAVRFGGVDSLALTKIDVLDGLDELKICTGYRLDGEARATFPSGVAQQARVEPVYETMPGWSGTTAGVRARADLPSAAARYIERLEELVGCPVAVISTGPDRDDTIIVHDPLARALQFASETADDREE